MRRASFLGDLLTQLFDRRGHTHGRPDTRTMPELCEALLSAEGEVSGMRLAATLLDRYRASTDAEKLDFFQTLNTSLEIDARAVARLASTYAAAPTTEGFTRLSKAAEPRRQELLRRLNQPIGATEALVAMRADLLRFARDHPELKRTDFDFMHLLRSWFNRGFLVLRQIDWDTPAQLLDKIVAYEAVHQIDDFDDLRRRLLPADRRCFAFFHPAMPDEPLIFVEVALTADVPRSIDALLLEGREVLDPGAAKAAVFYSISNCQAGLAGISFGNLLIKQVVAELAAELPNLETFVTLSPIPGLARWLQAQTDDPDTALVAASLLADEGTPDDLKSMAARYLLTAKREDGLPLDPVARFHLGNGAEVHDIHVGADTSSSGMAQSRGAMVNYLYNLSKTEVHHENYALQKSVAASRALRARATAPLETDPKEKTA